MADQGAIDFLVGSVDVALEILASVRDSPEAMSLRAQALDCKRHIEMWSKAPPTPEDRDETMKVVLRLHVAAAQLRRSQEDDG